MSGRLIVSRGAAPQQTEGEPAPASRDTPRDFPIQMKHEAQQLRAAGFSAPAILRRFERAGGRTPSLFTIYAWTDPRRAETARQSAIRWKAQQSAANATFALRSDRSEYRVAFMRALHDEGVPLKSIARVHRVVFREPIDEKTVKRRLEESAA